MLKYHEGEVIAIVDYGAGNLRSVVNAIASLGYHPEVTCKPDEIAKARAVILPGVGAAAETMKNLRAMGLDNLIRQLIRDGRPLLGVCIGLQVLFDVAEEGGWHKCLGIFPGRVRKFSLGLKIPHMGWNQVKQLHPHEVFTDIPDRANFYFVHSYYIESGDKSLCIGETEYGTPICSIIARENLIATQFHPEKSGKYGLKLYQNFLKLACSKQ
jgi:imidazole glycerol-phosphate synthase subunit HisH